MIKKIVSIIIIFSLLAPISLATSNNLENKEEKAVKTIEIQKDIYSLLNEVNQSILSYYLEKFYSFGIKMTGSKNASRAADWIKKEFEYLGLYSYFDEWKFPKYKDKNVMAIHNGTNLNSNAVILISAHYDTTKNSPGANDDGSGIAAMFTIANITRNLNFNHTIRFIAVSGEEEGTYGSFADAKKAYSKEENIIAILNIDTIGYTNKSDEHILQIFSSQRSEWLVDLTREIAEKYKSNFKTIIQYTMHYPADHESYNDLGYDGLQFVEVKIEDNKWIHSSEDTPEKIDYPYLINNTKLVLSLAFELADKPIDVQVQITRPKEGYIYFLNLPIVRLPCYNLCFTRIRAITYLFGKTTVKLNITTSEEINSVYFGIDGYVRHYIQKPPYEWKIGTEIYKFFKLKGFHRITVCVTTNTGKTAYDEMDVYILKRL